MKALLDYSKIEKYIIYNDMTKGSFCKNAEISYSTLKNVENEKGIAVASAQKNRRRPSHKSFIDYQRKINPPISQQIILFNKVYIINPKIINIIKTTKTVVLFFMVRRKQPQLNTSIKTVFC